MSNQANRGRYIVITIVIIILFSFIFNSCSPQKISNQYKVIAQFHPRSWYTDRLNFETASSADGQKIAYVYEYNAFVKDVDADSAINITNKFGYTWSWGIEWVNDGNDLHYNRMVLGEQPKKELLHGSFNNPQEGLSDVLNNFTTHSSDSNWVVYAGGQGVWARHLPDNVHKLVVPNIWVKAIKFSPTEEKFAYIQLNDSGLVNVYVADIADSSTTLIASNLDGSPRSQSIDYSPDGKSLYLSLATDHTSNLKDRHKPIFPERNFKIYKLDIASGNLTLMVDNIGENYITGVTDSSLFWTNVQSYMRIGIAPASGGESKILTDQMSSLSFWNPDGTQLSAMYGEWRMTDWALNWDLGVYTFDKATQTVSNFKPVVSGYHEDYALTWSPNGKWYAYHSHRSDIPVARYHHEHATDDIYLKSIPDGKEIRLTDFGMEAGTPEWAPDNKRLVFCSIGNGHKYLPWIITIDSVNGNPISVDSLKLPDDFGHVTSAVWSPNGKQLALDVTVGETGEHELWIVAPDGTNPKKISSHKYLPEIGGVDFSLDGSKLYYSDLQDGHHQIFAVDIESGNSEKITGVDDHEVIWPQVSPDGKLISTTIYKHNFEVRSQILSELTIVSK